MVHVHSLLLGLSAAGSTAAYAFNRPAKISLFEPSDVSEASSLTSLDCGAGKPSTDINLPINTCLWGDYSLVNNFKVTSLPTCANGAEPVAYFYSSTTCTGNPTFRSDEAAVDVSEQCLFGSSTPEWSMIFRCERLDSQAVASGSYVQAVPPNYTMKTPDTTGSDGIVTPHSSYDCTIWQPKEPTFLPADTCLSFDATGADSGHSVFVNKPATCADGSTAVLESFQEPGCQASEGDNRHSAEQVFDKTCYKASIRSMVFRCADKELEMFEDLAPYEHAAVEPLLILPAPPKPSPQPPTRPNKAPTRPQIPEGFSNFGSDAISSRPVKPFTPQSGTTQSAKVQPYYLADCKTDSRRNNPAEAPVDTCVWTFMYNSLQVVFPAICANGTQALLATYAHPGCKPEDLLTLGDLPEVYTEGCADIRTIDSYAFICEGLPEKEIGNKGNVGGFLKTVGIILLILFLMVALSIVSCCLKGAAMMKQATEVWGRLMEKFGRREGAIQL